MPCRRAFNHAEGTSSPTACPLPAPPAQFADRLFKCLVLFLLDVEDEQEWHTAQDEKFEHEGALHRRASGPS